MWPLTLRLPVSGLKPRGGGVKVSISIDEEVLMGNGCFQPLISRRNEEKIKTELHPPTHPPPGPEQPREWAGQCSGVVMLTQAYILFQLFPQSAFPDYQLLSIDGILTGKISTFCNTCMLQTIY